MKMAEELTTQIDDLQAYRETREYFIGLKILNPDATFSECYKEQKKFLAR